jgi:uncharacterized Fe-S cluster-containing radical SAM superfamily protein
MKVSQLSSPRVPTQLKYLPRDVPHGTIEPNRTCNIRCRYCYNLDRESIKELDLIKQEIDQLAHKRNLQVISLLGGEPTLHPDLCKIVSYIKSKNIACQLLTNGIAFLDVGGGRLLAELTASGIDKIIVHVDHGQGHVHGDIEKVRNELFSMFDAKGVLFSLSLTIDEEGQREIPDLVRRYARYRYFDGILAVLARDPLRPAAPKIDLFDVYRQIFRGLGLEPTAFIPSNLDDADVHWLIFLYLLDARSGQAIGFSPSLDQIWRNLYRLIRGRQFFIFRLPPFWAGLLSVPVCLGKAAVRPANLLTLGKFLWNTLIYKSSRFHYIAVQSPPEFEAEKDQIQLCYQCPDATIRNGLLTPVCLADKISPLNGSQPPPVAFSKNVVQSIYDHLESCRV